MLVNLDASLPKKESDPSTNPVEAMQKPAGIIG
jgi:hypothetical protein